MTPPARHACSAVTAFLCLSACSSDNAWRVPPDSNPQSYLTCAPNGDERGPLIESIDESARTWITFIEFTERGNLFNRGCLQKVYDHIENRIEASRGTGGVSLVAYIHGWKHDANPNDGNVRDFKRMLAGFYQSGQQKLSEDVQQTLPLQYRLEDGSPEPRTVVGVYVGWRGAVLADWIPDILENVSYWDRKSAAHEIGKGGVTEVLLGLGRLARCGTADLAARCPDEDLGNVFLTIGHSFGAGIAVAAMNEVILQRVVDARPADGTGRCIETRPLSDGLILINPAIEALQLLQVKEMISDHCFGVRQDILMHVLSSRGDIATHRAFPLGQTLDTLLTKQRPLIRSDAADRAPRRLHEHALDITTVGNYPEFWTGLLRRDGDGWGYTPLTNSPNPKDMDDDSIANHLWAPVNSPVQMIYTDDNFIEDHNAIFNDQVVAYANAVAAESLAIVRSQTVPAACARAGSLSFDFGACFDFYLEQLRSTR
jgi:hypothetical protein